ncbi:hypothetical protein Tco_0526866 [Tanacetum coccineum]
MKSCKETVKIRVCKGGAWERVDGALEYMPLNCVKRTLILPLLSSYSCLLEAVSERLEIDANSRFMVTYNSDNDIVEVCDDLEVNEFMEFVVKSSRIVTLCIVDSSVNGRQSSTTGSNQQSNFIHATPSVNVYQTEYHATQIHQTQMPVFPVSGGFYQNLPSYQQMHGFSENPVYVPGFLGYPMQDPKSDSANHGAHLKGEFLGTMYLAVAMDGNNQILPLAYGVGNKEELFWKACKAYRISDFEERFTTLRNWLPSVANKLDMIGLEKWARVHFPGRASGMSTCPFSHCSGVSGRSPGLGFVFGIGLSVSANLFGAIMVIIARVPLAGLIILIILLEGALTDWWMFLVMVNMASPDLCDMVAALDQTWLPYKLVSIIWQPKLSGNPPTRKQIEDLERQCEWIPLKFCYVEHGRHQRHGVGESNEVGESSGHQAVEPRWVNDKSRDHMVEVLEKSMKDMEQAREKDKELFEETIEQERKLNEEKLEAFKKETNDKLAEALAQLKEQPPTPHSA